MCPSSDKLLLPTLLRIEPYSPSEYRAYISKQTRKGFSGAPQPEKDFSTASLLYERELCYGLK